jgi:hypothetical protein
MEPMNITLHTAAPAQVPVLLPMVEAFYALEQIPFDAARTGVSALVRVP